jgi:Ca-activated chloride channel family protein
MQDWMIDFVFLRPWLLWLFIPWFLLTLLQWVKRSQQVKSTLIAPHLSHIVLSDGETKETKQSPALVSLVLALAILAVSGPSIEKQQVPVYSAKQARVVVVDLSYSMYATDIAPNRLTQVRFKLLDLVESFSEGETALVAYAGDAFTVSPLTTDAATLKNLIPSLSPEIMPSKGANLIAGIEQAKTLLTQASYLQGDIILVSDDVESDEISTVKSMLANSQYRLSVYAIGTQEGAPIALPDGGFLKDRFGQIVVPKLAPERLQSLVTNDGRFVTYSPSDSDINALKPELRHAEVSQQSDENVMWRVDAGVYLLLLIAPLSLLVFRKGLLQLSVVLCVLLLPSEQSYALELPSWLQNDDQKALKAYQQGQFDAATQADTKELKGAALYKQGQFQQAADLLADSQTAIGQYNLGNALAKLNQFDDAINAYSKALELQPEFKQAADNKALLEQLKQQQSEQQQQQGQQDQKDGEQSKEQNGEQSPNEQGQQSDQNGQQQDGQQQSGEQSQGSEQNDPSQSEKSGGEQNGQNNQPDMQAKPESKDDQAKSDEQQKAEQAQSDQMQSGEMQSDENAEQNKDTQAQMANEQAKSDEQAKAEQAISMADAKPLTPEEREQAEKIKHLLRKVPDDPAILLRNKMQLEAQQRAQQRLPKGVEKSW